MDYTKITEAYGNLVKAVKEEDMEITVSKIKVGEDGERKLFIKLKAVKNKIWELKD